MLQKETVTISGSNLKLEYYDKLGGNRQLVEDTLYIPEASNEKTLDAFFKHENRLYILQFTIAETSAGMTVTEMTGSYDRVI